MVLAYYAGINLSIIGALKDQVLSIMLVDSIIGVDAQLKY